MLSGAVSSLDFNCKCREKTSVFGVSGEVKHNLACFKPPSNFKLLTVPRGYFLCSSLRSLFCFGVSFCTVSPSICLDEIYLGSGS